MAGLTECRGPDPRDTFWTWRELMYRFLDRLDPQQVEAIAAFVQMEMLEAGYAVNVEFHYLHHQSGGQPYDNLDEMVQRVVCGDSHHWNRTYPFCRFIYQYGGCDARSLGAGQIRFGNTLNRYADLLAMSRRAVETLPKDCRLGVAPHSLRAIAQSDLASLVELADGDPFHMHIAEQVAEVEEVQAAWGARPSGMVAQSCRCDKSVVPDPLHADGTPRKRRRWRAAVLWPVFVRSPNPAWGMESLMACAGSTTKGPSLSDRIRIFEYRSARNCVRWTIPNGCGIAPVLPSGLLNSPQEDGSMTPFSPVVARRRDATAVVLKTGAWADMLALDNTAVDLLNRHGDAVLDSFIFAGDDRMVCDVWSAGRHMVRQGQHIDHDAITAGFAGVMMDLAEQI